MHASTIDQHQALTHDAQELVTAWAGTERMTSQGQVREAFGGSETPGGNALKFYASVRIDVRRIGPVGEEKVGSRMRAKVIKNKMAPPFREAEFDIRWGIGIDDEGGAMLTETD